MNLARRILEGGRSPLAVAVGCLGGTVLGTALLHGWPGATVGFLVGGLVAWLG